MDSGDQIMALCRELDALFDRYAREFDMTYATILGILFLKLYLMAESAGKNVEPKEPEQFT